MANLPLGVNKDLCLVINKDIFALRLDCAQYSAEFLYNRLVAFSMYGVPPTSTNTIAALARSIKENHLSFTAIKYLSSNQYVISEEYTPGAFVLGHAPLSVITKKDLANKSKEVAK